MTMVHAKSGDTRRLYQLVADQIRKVIAKGAFGPGSRLPPERELALQLGVSRPSLREALIALEIQGIIEIRMGSGLYVCAAVSPADETAALGESPSELTQARIVVESSVIALAAARATRQGLERVKQCLDAMRHDMRRGVHPVDSDRLFHVAIAELGGNALLARMVGDLFDSRHEAISSHMARRSESTQAWEVAFQEHERIYLALEACDPLEAAAAMTTHLKASQERWLERSAAGAPPSPHGAHHAGQGGGVHRPAARPADPEWPAQRK
jgi:GntR family transcriptional regulator, transcriptional repressor for pyruvate dehydrogenase complex